MAHSHPRGIGNRGDALRITRAAGSFIIELSLDGRVKAHYVVWRAAWAADQQRLSAALARPTRLTEAEFRAQIDTFTAAIHTELQRFIRDELALKPAWIAWVSDALRELFQLGVYNEQHPDTPKQFGIPVYLVPGTPAGRLPRQQGLDIDRNIRWFYQHKVQIKPAPIHDLARDYASYVGRKDDDGRADDCRSVVQNGIKQAEALLDLIAARAVRLPPTK
jgi:hypothetical protein